MHAQTLVALFSSLIAAVAIGYSATERSAPAAQSNLPQSISQPIAHRGSGRIGTSPNIVTFRTNFLSGS